MNLPAEKETPRSVYFHVPFCAHRCGYCNFTLVAGRDYLIERFLVALEKELHSIVNERLEVDTIYLGGGTPSHLNEKQLEKLGRIIHSRFQLAVNGEFTAECNPKDLDSSRANALGGVGVNRVSLGVQSTRGEKLKVLERDHDYEQTVRSVIAARTFANSVSVDLIFATPDETIDQWTEDLDRALQLQPDHFSTYELTFEKGTSYFSRLTRDELRESGEDLTSEMYSHTVGRLEEAGFSRYEISSFAKQGHRSRHNSMYWSGVPFYAFGPGAASYLDGIRRNNHRSTLRYLQLVEAGQSPVNEIEELTAEESARELLAIGLRQVDGVDVRQFELRTGFQPQQLLEDSLHTLYDNGLAENVSGRMRLTSTGLIVCDSIAEMILGR
ncbi:MAG: radical SAM family heme chaperone HemW [Planctomycetota bacterium]